MKWTKLIAIVILGTVTLSLVWYWALAPAGWWSRVMMTGVGETDEHIARRYFGPILLQTTLLDGPHNDQALRIWGEIETAYRLIAIIIGQFVVSTVAIMMIRRKTPTTVGTQRR